jgi:hypothetical protein
MKLSRAARGGATRIVRGRQDPHALRRATTSSVFPRRVRLGDAGQHAARAVEHPAQGAAGAVVAAPDQVAQIHRAARLDVHGLEARAAQETHQLGGAEMQQVAVGGHVVVAPSPAADERLGPGRVGHRGPEQAAPRERRPPPRAPPRPGREGARARPRRSPPDARARAQRLRGRDGHRVPAARRPQRVPRQLQGRRCASRPRRPRRGSGRRHTRRRAASLPPARRRAPRASGRGAGRPPGRRPRRARSTSRRRARRRSAPAARTRSGPDARSASRTPDSARARRDTGSRRARPRSSRTPGSGRRHASGQATRRRRSAPA